MTALEKLNKARLKIRSMDVKKAGRNSYSNYDYFTPEQVSAMVAKVNDELGLFTRFNLVRTQYGLIASLLITNLDDETDNVDFQIATEIPSIKATNVAQQLGGAVTYSQRYLLMIAYDITENSLDFDSHDNRNQDELLTKDQIRELDVLLSKTNYDDEKKEQTYNKFSKLTQGQFDAAKSKLQLDERSPEENENYSQKTINQILDKK